MRLAAAAILLASTTAAADPSLHFSPASSVDPHVYLYGATRLGNAGAFFDPAGGVEIGGRIADSPLWLHGAVLFGDPSKAGYRGAGDSYIGRGGLEARHCAKSSVVCGLVGVDAGAQKLAWRGTNTKQKHATIEETSQRGALVMPRAGVDFGGARFRAQSVLGYGFAAGGAGGVDWTTSFGARF